ncbi:MAG: hypothetical protein FWD93_04165 [Coriobacteriia bacterium]|nr:hypothetical protein [Coriobacteriia bacterium]
MNDRASRGWSSRRPRGCGCGCGTLFTVGGVLAMIISWMYNASIGWMLFHGLLGWWYVVYRLIIDWSGVWAHFNL